MKIKELTCVVAPRGGMGDCISFFAFFKTIAQLNKKKIILITHKNTSAQDVFEYQNIFHKIIYLDNVKKNFIYNILSYIKIFKLFSLLKTQGANKVIILHHSIKYVLISRLVGFYSIEAPGQKFQRFFLTKNRVYKNYFSKVLHPRDESEILIKKIFNLNKIEDNYFFFNKSKKKSFVAIGIAASGYEKLWPIENYVKVINYLYKCGFRKFLLLSGKNQTHLERYISNVFSKKKNIYFIKTSNLNIGRIIKYFNKIKFYIGNDTGFAHLSVSHEIPSIIIHGDCPPHSYSNLIYPILGKNNILSQNAIKKISFIKVKKKIKYLINLL
jgi:heptosyltransferase-2